jgi:hypothetical protein
MIEVFLVGMIPSFFVANLIEKKWGIGWAVGFLAVIGGLLGSVHLR